jgi:hypothetical protein
MLERRTFSLSDQQVFAELSGDDNPMHVDPVAARRLLFGGPVVHGIHAACWALDRWVSTRDQAVKLSSLNAVFLKPMRVGHPVELLVEDESDSSLKLRIMTAGELATRIVCEFETASDHLNESSGELGSADFIPDEVASRDSCRERSDYEGAFGTLTLLLPRDLAHERLPNLTLRLPHRQTAFLLATTRLVGTECPGLHSIYSALQLSFCDPSLTAARPELDWHVSGHDSRFGSVSLELASPHGVGSIRAFIRPQPQQQLPFADVKPLTTPERFAGVRALVIGGSRGFGEVCAKLLAAGGADVCIT